ncbi:hypothetical protein I305_04367 [Cryptococcus gattii E566]|uniref:Uncharacterized protein n=1 Tax=Cryptococcus gattii EJB2 TaxID=1296103 RepID=A0ABR5BRJ6_9TREE|nr:hypothetical protein I306_04710 [Cryptococcus gattii EJB2]KIY33040.1 hypothetical protein I305_04367 [Cryptococcus gattii E566]
MHLLFPGSAYTLPRMPPRLPFQPRALRLAPVTPPAGPSRLFATAPPTNPKPKGKSPASGDIPPLQRPLGTPIKPTSSPKSWQQKKDEMLDDDRAKAKRKALTARGGKLWIAPNVLIREDKANYFPDITGKSLMGQNVHTTDVFKGKATLVTIISTRLSEEHVQSFVQPVLEDLEGHPDFQFLTINHQPNALKSLLVSFFTSSLKRIVPEHQWPTYLISAGSWSPIDIIEPLGLGNSLLGYVFLVDHNAKVRWAACGLATEDEVKSFRRAAAVLVGRMKGGAGAGAGAESKAGEKAVEEVVDSALSGSH